MLDMASFITHAIWPPKSFYCAPKLMPTWNLGKNATSMERPLSYQHFKRCLIKWLTQLLQHNIFHLLSNWINFQLWTPRDVTFLRLSEEVKGNTALVNPFVMQGSQLTCKALFVYIPRSARWRDGGSVGWLRVFVFSLKWVEFSFQEMYLIIRKSHWSAYACVLQLQ